MDGLGSGFLSYVNYTVAPQVTLAGRGQTNIVGLISIFCK